MSPPITVKCPKCKAKSGEPCTYVNTRWSYTKYTGQVTFTYKKGEPTKRFHNERLTLASRPKRVIQPLQFAPAALISMREFDRREYNELKEWLRENWRIFR